MKRVTLLSCFIAALALSAMFAVAAEAKKAETGPMRLRSIGGESHLGSSQGTITSTTNKGHGLFETETTGTADSAFFNVEATALSAKCQSGTETGVVRTKKLIERTAWINKAGGEAGVVFEAGEPPYLAEFECGGIGVKVKGSVIGRISPLNTMAGKSKLDLQGTGFHNEPEEIEGEPPGTKHILESEFSVAPPGTEFESLQEQKNVEVKDLKKAAPCKHEEETKEKCKEGSGEINGSGATNPLPALGRCGKAKKSSGNYENENCTTKSGTPGTGGFEWFPAS